MIFFAYNITLNMINEKRIMNQHLLKIVEKLKIDRNWKDANEAYLNSLYKRQVFGPVVQTPHGVEPI